MVASLRTPDVIERLAAVWSGRRWHAAFVLYGAAFAAVLVSGAFTEDTRALVANLWYLPIGGAAAVLAWLVSVTAGLPFRQRLAWRLFALASLASLGADVLWMYVENIRGEDPSTHLVANVGYLLYYPGLLAGLLLLPAALRSKQDAVTFGLDVATVVIAGGMAVWHFVIAPSAEANDATPMASLLALAYPVGDLLILLGVATILLRYPRGDRRRPIMLLAASVTAMMVADVVWAHLSLNGSFQAGNVQDLPYLVQYVLFAMAVAEERRRLAQGDADTFDHSSGSVSALPYVAVVGGYALFIGAALNELTRELLPVAAGAVVLTALIIAKQIMALRENARLDLERTMLAGEKRFKSLIQHASDVVSIIDGHWQVRFASPSAAQILGYPAASLVGRSVLDLMHPDDLADATQRLKDLIRRPGEIITARWRLRHHEGHWVQTDTTATNLIGDENIRGLVLASRDITERVSMETRLTHQAFHDPLTGLANRTLFQHRIGEALARRRADGGIVAVLFIDLDKFKDANDGYGHAFGDAILRAAGERIVSGLRRFDTAARLGGDEFAVLIDDPSGVTDPVGISERLAHTFHAPVRIEGRDIVVTASIGVAVATNDHGADELQRDADLAMYLAKGRGRGQAATFEPSLHAALVSRLELQADLEEAATRGELRLVYQPLHALDSHQLVGAEAFIRWHHPARGVIPPDVFIPIAEETGLILPMGRWVLEQACADARRWMRDEPGHPPVRLSINVSGRQVAESSLADDVERALRSSGLEGSRLVLELPESILLDHTPTTLAVIGEIRRLGIHIAIDDFGTGYSSLSYLQRLPIDELKIDRSFVERLATDRGTAALTRAIVAIASTLSLRTVAEGIQTAEDAEHLRQLGCQWGQGFFFSRPMPIDEFELYTRRCRIISAA